MMIDQEVVDLMLAAEWAEQGVWPIAVGWLDQAKALLDGIKFIRKEKRIWSQCKPVKG